jgi:uncharacterized protein (TIGR03435 family)
MRPAASLLLVLSAAWGQADASLKFEVVSIKPVPPGVPGPGYRGCRGGPGSSDPGRIRCRQVTVTGLSLRAYGLQYFRTSGLSPGDNPSFEIDIKVPVGTTQKQVPLMFQNLLAERFHFAAHYEPREMPVYVLVVVKGGFKLKESAEVPDENALSVPAEGEHWFPPQASDGHISDEVLWSWVKTHPRYGALYGQVKARWFAPRATIADLIDVLENHLQRRVVDSTGLKGKYDFKFWWLPWAESDPPAEGPTLFEALRSQLGLMLESKKTLVDVLVVDHVDKLPTGN